MSSYSTNSSRSSNSQSSVSSESSTWSSESSAWDVPPWYSLVRLHQPVTVSGVVRATVELDLRHSDGIIVKETSPLIIEAGGTFGETTVPALQMCLLDGQKIVREFENSQDALEWQETLYLRIRTEIRAKRGAYTAPADFEERHRLV